MSSEHSSEQAPVSWFDRLMADAEDCRRKAAEAKTPAVAKRWFEAAEAASRAAHATWPYLLNPAPLPMPAYPAVPNPGYQPPDVGGYQCGVCGVWVMTGQIHACGGITICEGRS